MSSLVLVPLMVVSGAAVVYGRGTTITPGIPHEMILAFLAIAVVALVVFPALIGRRWCYAGMLRLLSG